VRFQQGDVIARERDWWPNALNLRTLSRNDMDPMPEGFDTGRAFEARDLDAAKADLAAFMTNSQKWCPRLVTGNCSRGHDEGSALPKPGGFLRKRGCCDTLT
jgi:catalase (peroxidase I)